MSRPTLALVSSMYSPFQVELARAINATQDVDYHALFTVDRSKGRGSHWTQSVSEAEFTHLAPSWTDRADLTAWLRERLRAIDPDVVVVTGILRAHTYASMADLRPEMPDVPVGYWLEHPDLSRPWPVRAAIDAAARWQLRDAPFIFAIGDRAQRYYRRVAPKARVHVVPYGQDLSPSFAIARNGAPDGPVTFLFSGQLVRRNNIKGLVGALDRLARSHPGRFRFICAAGGPEEPRLLRAMSENPALHDAVEFDRVYATWNDRLRPFANADVLVCPSLHAGWALVVPEAMAAGLPVIATRYVNAARYFVRPEVSGLTVTTDADSIHRAMARYVDDPAAVRRMGDEARRAAQAGTAEFIAARWVEAATQHLRTG